MKGFAFIPFFVIVLVASVIGLFLNKSDNDLPQSQTSLPQASPTSEETTMAPTKTTSISEPMKAPTSTPIPASGINLGGNSSVRLDSITPNSAADSQAIILRGSGFGSDKGYVVFYNAQGMASGSPAIDSWSDTEIHTKVYFVKGGTFYLAVKKPNNDESNKIKFTVTAGQPYIGSINGANIGPFVLKRNAQVVISGSEFGSSTGAIEFQKSGSIIKASISSWSDTEVKFTLPAELVNTTYDMFLKTSDNRSSSSKYVTVAD